MERCIIGFSTSDDSFISKTIRYFRGSEYSHTFVILAEIAGKLIAGEASTYGVQIAPLHIKPSSKIELWEIKGIDAAKLQAALGCVIDLTGRSYGYFQLIGFIWIWLLEKVGIKAKSNPFQDGIICSEYVYYFIKELCYEPALSLKANETAPDDELRILRNDPQAKCIAKCEFGDGSLTWI